MSNTFSYVDWLSMETLRILKNKLQVAQFFDTSYEKEFTREFAVGDTVRVKYPQRFISRRNTLAYNPQAISRRTTTIVVDQIFGADFEWDSAEAALKLERGREKIQKEYLEPAAAQIAQDIDSYAALYAKNHANNIVGTLGADPTSFKEFSGRARQRLIELACPPAGEKGLIIPPRVNTELVAAQVAYFNPSSDISKAYRDGSIGRNGGFDWYESMSLQSHTAGVWAAAVTNTGTITTDGTTSLPVTCTTGDTFLEGDVVTIDAVYEVNPSTRRSTGRLKQFVVRANATGSGSAATLTLSPAMYGPNSVYQNVDALPVAAAALTLFPGTAAPGGKSGTNGLAIHKSAFAMVGVKLEMPKAVELASQTQDPDTGISVRFVRAWDQTLSKMTNRFDCLLGFGDLYPDFCIRVLSA